MAGFFHERHFTIEQANSLIPTITPLLVRIQRSVELHERQLQRALSAGQAAQTNGKKHEPDEPDALIEIEDLTVRVEAYGCVIRDHAKGLIDFPSLLDGREVYLCWKLGESEITSWHEIDGGFAARKSVHSDLQFRSTL